MPENGEHIRAIISSDGNPSQRVVVITIFVSF